MLAVFGIVALLAAAGAFVFWPEAAPDEAAAEPPARSERANPEPRQQGAMVFDATVGRAVVFGGTIQTEQSVRGVTNETWQFEGSEPAWWYLQVRDVPQGRTAHTLVFDEGAGLTVLFGGSVAQLTPCPGIRWCAAEVLGDTWVFDAVAGVWTQRAPADAPPPRAGHAGAFDPVSGRVIVFGGHTVDEDGVRASLADTWAYDTRSDSWIELTPPEGPSARSHHAMAFDPSSGRILVWGGAGSAVPAADLWAYDPAANTWTLITGDMGIGQRWMGAAAADAASGKVVLFGGDGRVRDEAGRVEIVTGADVFVVDGSTGSVVRAADHDTEMWRHAAVYDPASDRILVVAIGRTWLYDVDADAWEDITERARSLAGQPYSG